MLTVRFDRSPSSACRRGRSVLDAGAGFGRHAFELARRGYRTVALDRAADEVAATQATLAAMAETGEVEDKHVVGVLRGDATALPFADESLRRRDHVGGARAHPRRRRRPRRAAPRAAAAAACSPSPCPSWLPEKINWMLSDEYHAPAAVGGHVRIYSATELKAKLRAAGLDVAGSHHAHALHSPYWWLKCAVGVDNDDHPLVRRYRQFLEWDITRRPRSTRVAERVLSPVLGKSLVLYGVAR